MNSKFYLTSRHGNCGSNVMWWNKNGAGYGTDLTNAHIFDFEEAQKHQNTDREALPLLKIEVDKLRVKHVDTQLLDSEIGKPNHDDSECIIQIDGVWDGNDIQFAGLPAPTFNLQNAQVFSYKQAKAICTESHTIWLKSYLESIARWTFQKSNINIRKMTINAGIKLKKKTRERRVTGKTRGNCPTCGKITWDYNPHENAYCLEHRYE